MAEISAFDLRTIMMIKIDKTGHDSPLFMAIQDKLLTVFASFHTMKSYTTTCLCTGKSQII